jgi:hypothetical protein
MISIFNKRKGDDKKEFNELLILNNSIKFVIEDIRRTSYLYIDIFIASLIKYFKGLKGMKGFDEFDFYLDNKRNQYVFFFPLSTISTKIVFPDNGFSFNDLLVMSKETSEDEYLHVFYYSILLSIKSNVFPQK